MLNAAGLSNRAEGRCVEMYDPICEICGGYRAVTIYVIGAENSDGRNTWDWTALERLRERCCVRVDSWWQDRRTLSYRIVPYRTYLTYLTVPYHTVPYLTYLTVPYHT